MRTKLKLALRWARYANSSSYYHLPQARGRAFVPAALEGYFNDLTGKTAWKEGVDAHGIPLHHDAAGNGFYFPITIIQKGLGHWDRWWLSKRQDEAQLAEALAISRWLLQDQDDQGGWPCWNRMKAATVSPYSAMAQGQAISLLARLYAATGSSHLLEAARRSYALLRDEQGSASVVRNFRGFTLLEEYPKAQVNGVLNGWIFAAFGLYDYALLEPEAEIRQAAQDAFQALDACVAHYDTGTWSAYDLNGRIASPFYHNLHIAQLDALAEVFPNGRMIRPLQRRFAAYRSSTFRMMRAVSRKVVQKLREKDYEVLT